MLPTVKKTVGILPDPNQLAAPLLDWYAREGRSLPWRGVDDLYAILVSELMCQQTRIDTALRYFGSFMERFPTAQALASASEEEVMSAWAGLGFYRRARNLHRAAQIIVEEHGGRVPECPDTLGRLPGLGRYTVGAILSSGRNAKLPILDGNVIRVLSRVYSIDEAPDRAAPLRRLWELAEAILPDDRPGDFNQAIMDLGATVCRHPSPNCTSCPFVGFCTSHASGQAEEFPRPGRRSKVKTVRRVALFCEGSDGRFLLRRRPADGLLSRLWELPSADLSEGEDAESVVRRLVPKLQGLSLSGTVEHRFSHRHWTTQVYRATAPLPSVEMSAESSSESNELVVREEQLSELGIPTATKKTIDCALSSKRPPDE